MIYVCVHSSYLHFFDFGLRSICDLAASIRRYGDSICWEDVTRRAVEWRAANCVFLCLQLTEELLRSPVSAAALEALRPGGDVSELTELARERIFAEKENDAEERRLLWEIAELPENQSPLRRASRVFTRVFPPRDEIARMYSIDARSALVGLYYMGRPSDLLVKHGGTASRLAWRALRREKKSLSPAEAARLRRWLTPDTTRSGGRTSG